MNRLMLTPGLRRLWRDEREIQFGVDPARAIVIHLTDAADARLFDLLDGTRSERGVLRDATSLGIGSRDAFELLSVVREAGLVASAGTILPDSLTAPARGRLAIEAAALAVSRRARHLYPEETGSISEIGRADPSASTDATGGDVRSADHGGDAVRAAGGDYLDGLARTADVVRRCDADDTKRDVSVAPTPAEALRRRSSASVVLTGGARLVVPIAAALAGAGIGHVDPALKGRVTNADVAPGGLSPADVGGARGTAATAVAMRAAPEVNTRRLRDGAASFVVQVGAHAPAELLAHGLARRRLPHLLIEERDESILVGPLVVPGRTPCLNCLDLHRKDRDAAWPALAAQIATAPEGPGATATSTVMIATGIAIAQILGHIDGIDVDAVGGSIEVSPPARIRRRSWGQHPACRCLARQVRNAPQSRVGAGLPARVTRSEPGWGSMAT